MVRGIFRSWGGRAVTSAVSLAVLAACSSGDPASPPPGTSSPAGAPSATSSPSTALSAEEKAKNDALAAYRGMWQNFVEAGRTSDWQSPKLGQHATGVALTNLSRGLYADHYNGLVTKGQPVLNPTVSSVEPAGDPKKIIISDCGDSTDWLKYRADNGQLADNEPGGRQAINAIVEKQSDGSWKVSDFGVHDVGTC
ncbi:hypothetical protein GCM10010171_63220 [Actinokineospora fastidiosa]|uniref:Secreted protein/lipoprotein n=1 Tax=Actinokineospora fastidiosa TaxID=1816 RepID=A0A918GTJ9_9PSEU|nr:hypothetical protein GCM10010171_63220 [Actinokineospora fastidiosa]